MKTKLKNQVRGDILYIYASTKHGISSDGQAVWFDRDRQAYGLAQYDEP